VTIGRINTATHSPDCSLHLNVLSKLLPG